MASTTPRSDRQETARVDALARYEILDTAPEAGFDALVALAAHICDAPMATLSLMDRTRQWTKAAIGLPIGQSLPRKDTFCNSTIQQTELVEISDTTKDPRFAANPFVCGEPNIRFYAGLPLVDSVGHAIGTICVFDLRPRTLTTPQRDALALVRTAAMALITSRTIVPRAEQTRLEALAAAVESAAEPIVIHLPASRGHAPLAYVNVAFTTLFGFTADELIARESDDVELTDDERSRLADLRAKLFEHASHDASFVLHAADGTPRDIEMRSRPIHADLDGPVASWVITLRDATQERRATDIFARQAMRTRALYAIAASHGEDANAQIDAALELGRSSFGADHGFVFSIHDDMLTLTNLAGLRFREVIGTSFPLAETRFAKAFLSGDVVVSDDVHAPDASPRAKDIFAPYASFVVAPISVDNRKFGAIGFASQAPRDEAFSPNDREFVRLIGALVGSAIERQDQRERLDALAFHDTLTSLPNRALFNERLAHAISDAEHGATGFAVHYLDLDGFKAVNDVYGHLAGDDVLRYASERLGDAIRAGDTVARLGGDEFVVLQREVHHRNEAAELAERLVASMRAPLGNTDAAHQVRASVGVSIYPHDATTATMLVGRADEALYTAKRLGKNRVAFAADHPTTRKAFAETNRDG